MSEPGIGKVRRRSARVYVRPDRLTPEELDQRLAVVARYFPSDEDQPTPAHSEARSRTRAMMQPDEVKRDIGQADRERLAREGKALVNQDGHVSYPIETAEDLRNAAALARSGHGDVKRARKLIARRARELGVANPLKESAEKAAGNPVPSHGGRPATDRLSPSRVTGQAAASTGDHNASAFADPMAQPGPCELAFRHPDLRQSSTVPFPLAMMTTYNGDNGAGDRDIVFGAGRVNVSRLDAAAAAGMSSAPGNPASRPMPHIAPIGQHNGTHSLSQPEARHPMSMKFSDRLEVMKREQRFPGGGGVR